MESKQESLSKTEQLASTEQYKKMDLTQAQQAEVFNLLEQQDADSLKDKINFLTAVAIKNISGVNFLHRAIEIGNQAILDHLYDTYQIGTPFQQLTVAIMCNQPIATIKTIIDSAQKNNINLNIEKTEIKYKKTDLAESYPYSLFYVDTKLLKTFNMVVEPQVISGGAHALHYAAEYGRLAILKYLIKDRCFYVNVTNGFQQTPFLLAAKHGQLEVVKFLHEECNCSTHIYSSKNQTPLHVAAHQGHLEVVKYLVEKFPEYLQAVNIYGQTPYELACEFNQSKVVNYFEEYFTSLMQLS